MRGGNINPKNNGVEEAQSPALENERWYHK